MLTVTCTGTPNEIGIQHGNQAKDAIRRCLEFYKRLFQIKCKMSWPMVYHFALEYQPFLRLHFPDYIEEMQGVAEGAGLKYVDVLALNVRTEIAFGAFSDGCTAFYQDGVLAQNWDWNTEFVFFRLPLLCSEVYYRH
jgi:isopenicillin-N N-acyltransferase-like protein